MIAVMDSMTLLDDISVMSKPKMEIRIRTEYIILIIAFIKSSSSCLKVIYTKMKNSLRYVIILDDIVIY